MDESADSSLVASLTEENDDDDFFDFDATRGPKMRLREFKE